jgi:hypothetical protein
LKQKPVDGIPSSLEFRDDERGTALRKALFTILTLPAAANMCGCNSPAQLSATHAASDPWPMRKAGVWAQTLTRDGHALRTHATLVCLDGGPITDVGALGHHLGANDCDQHVSRTADGVYHFTSACHLPAGAKLTTRGIARGDFASHYRIDADVAVNGAPISALDGQHQLTLVGAYRGPCPAGSRPGHLVEMDRQKPRMAERAAL